MVNKSKIIIHLSGLSGSGKTTLGNEFKSLKQVKLIDTDEIDDKIALDVLKTHKHLLTGASIKKYFKIVKKSDTKKYIELIENALQKIIIICGRIIDIDAVIKQLKKSRCNYKFYGYFLKVDPLLIFKRLNIRHLDLIAKYHNSIKKEFNNVSNHNDVHMLNILLLHKFELRSEFYVGLDDMINHAKNEYTKMKKNGYTIDTPANIKKYILRLINLSTHVK